MLCRLAARQTEGPLLIPLFLSVSHILNFSPLVLNFWREKNPNNLPLNSDQTEANFSPSPGNTTLEVLFLAGKFCLVKTYMKHSPNPHTAENYSNWIRNNVKNQYLLFLNQLIFGCLESYFVFKVY